MRLINILDLLFNGIAVRHNEKFVFNQALHLLNFKVLAMFKSAYSNLGNYENVFK